MRVYSIYFVRVYIIYFVIVPKMYGGQNIFHHDFFLRGKSSYVCVSSEEKVLMCVYFVFIDVSYFPMYV